MSETNLSKDNALTFQVGELDFIIKLFDSLPLVGYEGRMKVRFMKMLIPRLEQFKEEYNNAIQEHAILDENKNPVSKTLDNGMVTFEVKDIPEFKKAVQELVEEDFVIRIDDYNKELIKSSIDSLIRLDKQLQMEEFKGEDAFIYESVYEKLTNLKL